MSDVRTYKYIIIVYICILIVYIRPHCILFPFPFQPWPYPASILATAYRFKQFVGSYHAWTSKYMYMQHI